MDAHLQTLSQTIPCPFLDCLQTPKPSPVYWAIKVNDQYWALQKTPDTPTQFLIPHSSTMIDIIKLFIDIHHMADKTAIEKVLFINSLKPYLTPTPIIYNWINLPYSLAIKRQIGPITALSKPMQHYAHKTKLSLKLCYKLAQFSASLLELAAYWLTQYPISPSIMLECLQGLSDHLKNHDLNIKTLQQYDITTLRKTIRTWRHPIITKQNDSIQTIADQIQKKYGIQLTWDPTLETHQLSIILKIKDMAALKKGALSLAFPQFESSINTILSHYL